MILYPLREKFAKRTKSAQKYVRCDCKNTYEQFLGVLRMLVWGAKFMGIYNNVVSIQQNITSILRYKISEMRKSYHDDKICMNGSERHKVLNIKS